MYICKSQKSQLEKLYPASYLGMFGAVENILREEDIVYRHAFLNPHIQGDFIQWEFMDYNVEVYTIKSSEQWNTEERNFVGSTLSQLANLVEEKVKLTDIQDYAQIICNTPDEKSIFLLETSGGQRIAIANWGHNMISKEKRYTVLVESTSSKHQQYSSLMKVVFQDGAPAANHSAILKYQSNEKTIVLDEEGMYDMGKLRELSIVHVTLLSDDGQRIDLGEIITEASIKTYILTVPPDASLVVRVTYSDGSLTDISTFTLLIDDHGSTKMLHDGYYFDEKVNAGKECTVILDDAQKSTQNCLLERGENKLSFVFEKPVEVIEEPIEEQFNESVKFFFFDHKNKPLEIESGFVDLVGNERLQLKKSNDENHWLLNSEQLSKTQKVTVHFQYNSGKKQRKGKSSFLHRASDRRHDIRIKTKWWLLSLLLIPLMLSLLLTFEKDYELEITDDSNLPVDNALVNFSYTSSFLYNFDSGEFLDEPEDSRSDSTDVEGKVMFKSIKYSLYDRVFRNANKAEVSILNQKECLKDSSCYLSFHGTTTKNVEINSHLKDYEFYVRDAISGDPISDATVKLTLYSRSDTIHLNKISSSEGKITLADISSCSYLINSEASKNNYFPFSIKSIELEALKTERSRTYFLSQTFACDSPETGDVAGGIFVLHVPNKYKTYQFQYDFRRIPDNLIVYEGTSNKGRRIKDFGWEGGGIVRTLRIKPVDFCNGCEYVTVQIRTDNDDTGWDVEYLCE